MSKSGTTRSKIVSRRKTARVSSFLRRAGLVLVAVLLAGGGVSWLFTSGAAQRGWEQAQQSFYDRTAAQGFAVRNVLVEGRNRIDADVLLGLVNVERGTPIFSVDPRAVREAISQISWVKDVRVERRLPDTIYVRLTEREPLALWQSKGRLRLIDKEGVTLSDSNLEPYKGLLIVVGDDAPRHAAALIELLGTEPILKDRTEAATRVGGRRWDLKLKGGIDVKLPEQDIGFALRRLAQADEQDALLTKSIESIDLREADRMSVRTIPGTVQDYVSTVSAPGNEI